MKASLTITLLALVFSAAITLGGCTENSGQIAPRPAAQVPPKIVTPGTKHELNEFFASYSYDWTTLDKGVPPFILGTLPADLNRISRVDEKKRVFFLSLLPMVLMVNDEISRQRQELVALFELHDAGKSLKPEQLALVAFLAREYGLNKDPLTSSQARKTLLRRVDIIPPSLALAQAATESAYGTSRFAKAGNNLFGEWTYTPGTGLVPKERPAGETYEVRRFENLYDSVRSYMRNLNTHRAYRPLREQRAHLRAAGLPLRGMDLARGLKLYSARKEAYVEDIRAIIRRNHLSLLAAVSLRDSLSLPPAQTAEPSSSGLLASLGPSSRTRSQRSHL